MSNNSQTYVFTDLDDTLIQTRGKVPSGYQADAAALDKDGAALSFICPHQQTLLRTLAQGGAMIIPVTGRNTDALQRVTLPFFQHYRIVSHGALILRADDSPCPEWLAHLARHHDLAQAQTLLDALNAQAWQIIEQQQLPARSRVITDQGVPAYLSIKTDCAEQGAQALDQLVAGLNAQRPADSRWHRNGRNLALRMPYTCKREAVRFLLTLLNVGANDLTLGLGDSLTDLPFMRETHFALMPTGSQIDQEITAL